MHRVGFFVFPDHQILDLWALRRLRDGCAAVWTTTLCAWHLVADRGGVPVMTRAADQAHPDTLVGGGGDISFMLKVGEVQAVACLARGASRIASVCTGPFLLTEAASSV